MQQTHHQNLIDRFKTARRLAEGTFGSQMKPHRTRTLCLTLMAFVSVSAARSDVFYVGSTASGCNAATLANAIFGALLSGGDDEIRLTTDLTNIQQELLNWDPAGIGGVTIRGGYSNCSSPASTGTTVVSGTNSGPVFDIRSTGGIASVIALERLVIQGASNSRAVSVDGDGASLDLANTEIRFSQGGLVATNGAQVDLDHLTDIHDNDVGTGAGGGIWCVGSSIESSAAIAFNQASTGGGAWLQGGCVFNQFDGSFVANNEADYGGGFALAGGSTQLNRPISFANDYGVRIVNNTASVHGGGVWVSNATAVLRETWIRGNSAGARGGGIFAAGAEILIEARDFNCFSADRCSWLEGNTLTGASGNLEGSVLYATEGSDVSIYQTFIEGSSAIDNGGSAIFATDTDTVVLIEGAQLAGNTAFSLFTADDLAIVTAAYVSAAENRAGSGPVHSIGATASAGGRVQIYSSVLWDHSAFLSDTGAVDLDCVMAETLTGATSATGGAVAGVDPLFRDAAGHDLRVVGASMAVDFCDESAYQATHTDLRHQLRGFDYPSRVNNLGPFDLGAYEFYGGLFEDGFESGDTTAWGIPVP